jgi:hypothetical protein
MPASRSRQRLPTAVSWSSLPIKPTSPALVVCASSSSVECTSRSPAGCKASSARRPAAPRSHCTPPPLLLLLQSLALALETLQANSTVLAAAAAASAVVEGSHGLPQRLHEQDKYLPYRPSRPPSLPTGRAHNRPIVHAAASSLRRVLAKRVDMDAGSGPRDGQTYSLWLKRLH